MANASLAFSNVIRTKKCLRCSGVFDEEAGFRKNSIGQLQLTRAICVGCELTKRNDPTPEQRAGRKAAKTIVTHAKKYKMKPREFANRYGWNVKRMTYDILHGYENTCPYCNRSYSSMGNGLSDITLDVVDPEQEPYYATNVRWCCSSDNQEKATMLPQLWARRLMFWRQWEEWQQRLRANPTVGLPLFDAAKRTEA